MGRRGPNPKLNYQLMVATDHGDTLRAQQIHAELAVARAARNTALARIEEQTTRITEIETTLTEADALEPYGSQRRSGERSPPKSGRFGSLTLGHDLNLIELEANCENTPPRLRTCARDLARLWDVRAKSTAPPPGPPIQAPAGGSVSTLHFPTHTALRSVTFLG